MNISEFDYILPEELIAQMPADKRENSKMLVLDKTSKTIEHKNFYNIVDYIDENSILVLNNTKRFYRQDCMEQKIPVQKSKYSYLKQKMEIIGHA